jgi:hypothetical protein
VDRKSFYTATEICTQFGVTDWHARRAIDALGDRVPRAGRSRYRLVLVALLEDVRAELAKRGYLPEAEVAHA